MERARDSEWAIVFMRALCVNLYREGGEGPCWPPPRPVNMGELLPNDSFVCLGRCSAVSMRSWCFQSAPSFASAGFPAFSV